jgi:hypothetical protein
MADLHDDRVLRFQRTLDSEGASRWRKTAQDP